MEGNFSIAANFSEQFNKYLIINSVKPINLINFSLPDLKSRINSFILIGIELPTDDLLKVIISKSLCPISDVLTFFHVEDKRGIYVYPWEGTTVIGTTDLDHDEDLDIEASISDLEVDYLLILCWHFD